MADQPQSTNSAIQAQLRARFTLAQSQHATTTTTPHGTDTTTGTNASTNTGQTLEVPWVHSANGVESPGSSVFDLPVHGHGHVSGGGHQESEVHVRSPLTRRWSVRTERQESVRGEKVCGGEGLVGNVGREPQVEADGESVQCVDGNRTRNQTQTQPQPQPQGLTTASGSKLTFVVISVGTGCNSICSAFGDADACYVLPVSDAGGSSSETIRGLGGPSIGMLRQLPINCSVKFDIPPPWYTHCR